MRPTESRLKIVPSKSSRRPSSSIRSHATFVANLGDIADPVVAIPPDGGWGWVIVIVSCLIMFCIDGIGYCFALFFEDISRDFQCEITEVAIVSSLVGGFYYLAGPVTCSAVNRIGFQAIAVVGGALAVIAFLTASFLTTLLPFLILVGCLGGTAFNLIYTPSVIAIGFYFERWRALAMAICCCGSSLGVMCFPLITIKLLEGIHWKDKFKIVAGVFGICGLLGLTFRPIKVTKVERIVQFGEISHMNSSVTFNDETEVKLGIANIFQRFKNALFPTISEASVFRDTDSTRYGSRTSSLGYNYFMHRQEDETISTYIVPESSVENIGRRTLDTQEQVHVNNGCREECRSHCCPCRCKQSPCCLRAGGDPHMFINRPMYRDDIFYGGSVYTLPQYPKTSGHIVSTSKQFPSLAYTLSVSRAPTQRDLQQQKQCVCCPEAVLRVLATMLHFQMLKSPSFLMLLVSGYLSLMGTYIVFTYLPSYAVQKGMDNNLATMMLSVIGVANTIGRAACGVVSCFPILDVNIFSWLTICISGVAIISSVFIYSSTGYIIIYAIFGFNLASFAVFRPVIFVEMYGLENLTNCFGLNMIFQSLAAFSSTPIANSILYHTDSFHNVFIFTGVAVLLSGMLLIPIKCVLKWEQRFKKKVTFV